MKQEIEKFNKFYQDLYEDWLDDIISDEELLKKEYGWLIQNGSEELFNYLIDKYKNSRSESKYKKYKEDFNNK